MPRTVASLSIRLGLSLALASTAGALTQSPASEVSLGISIGRDAHGVPHVFARTDAGAYYGLGYATAEDRLFQMCWMRLVVQGRVSEYMGPGSVVNPTTGAVKKTHVISDRKARLHGWTRHAGRVVQNLDIETHKLLDAYANGVNAYVRDAQGALDPMFARFALPVEPWTAADCVALWIRFGDFFASGGLDEARLLHDWQALVATPGMTQEERIHALLGALVCDDSAAVIDPGDVPIAQRNLLQSYADAYGLSSAAACVPYNASPHFSHAWAVGGQLTTTGNSVLLGDPRIKVTEPSQLYEWMVEGATFAVRGVGVPGSPNVLSGMTNKVAWSPTALGVDQTDLIQLRVDPVGHPGQYQLDGQWIPFQDTSLETIHVLGEADDAVLYRESFWGPVVTAAVQDARPGEEFAMRRVPLFDPYADTAQGSIAMFRAVDAAGFQQALGGWTFPSVNVVFADSNGGIGYSVAGSIPLRNPKVLLAGVIAQDGSTTESDWLDLLPHALTPHVIDPAAGYVFSANHRPVGSWYPIPIRFGSGGSGDTFRSRRVREVLGVQGTQFEPKDLLILHSDVVGVGPRDFTEIGLWLRNHGVALTLDARRALTELGPWLSAGAKMDGAVRGVLIASSMDLSFRLSTAGDELVNRYGGGENGINTFLKQALAKIHALPPVALTAAEVAFVDRVLSDAVRQAQSVGPTTVWLNWFRSTVLTVDLPQWTSLEGFPSLTPELTTSMGPFRAVDINTLLSPLRQSYTQFVDFAGQAPKLSLAPPGNASPSNSHDALPSILWVQEQLKPSPLSRQELLAAGPVHWTNL